MTLRLTLLLYGAAWLWLVATASVLNAADKKDLEGLEDFKPLISTNQTLALSLVDVITLTNGKTYLLSLGTTGNQARQDSSIRAKLHTRKVAEAKARKNAAEFLKVDVSTEEKLVELRRTEKVSANEGLKSQVTNLIKEREAIITSKSQIVFAGSRTVATWLSPDSESFNAVVAFEITCKEPR